MPSTSSSAPPDPASGPPPDPPRRSRARWILPVVLVVAALVGIGAWIDATGGDSSPPPTASSVTAGTAPGLVSTPGIATAGSVAPDFDLPRLRGSGSVKLSSLRGTGVVVNFWASWCVPCRKEFPVLRRVQRQYRGKGVEIVGIVYNDIPSDARAFARDERATWNLVTDDGRQTAIAYGVRAIPQTFFIAPDGRISQRYFQAPSEATFDAEIEKILPAS